MKANGTGSGRGGGGCLFLVVFTAESILQSLKKPEKKAAGDRMQVSGVRRLHRQSYCSQGIFREVFL